MTNINPVTDLVMALTGKDFYQSAEPIEIIELGKDETYPLEPQTQIIRVLSGSAWITVNGEDRIVAQGQDMLLKPGKEKVIISSANTRPLVFEIESL